MNTLTYDRRPPRWPERAPEFIRDQHSGRSGGLFSFYWMRDERTRHGAHTDDQARILH